MKRLQGQIAMGLFLIALSAGLYIAQIRIFHAERDTFFYLFQDLAFVPIQVLLLTVIVDQVLRIREKMAMLNKLNMVIGTFFSEMGTGLLKSFAAFDDNADELGKALVVADNWSDAHFTAAAAHVRSHEYRMRFTKGDPRALKAFLAEKRDFLLGLLENPNLLEHESFTELLWAVFHLAEELSVRNDLSQLSEADSSHLAGDMRRAHALLVFAWLAYLKHLKQDYPYLFSFAVRTNPFDPEASVTVS